MAQVRTVEILRYCRTAGTFARRAAARLRAGHAAAKNDEVRWLYGYEAHGLAVELADALEVLADLIPPDLIEEAEQAARDAAKRFRDLRLAAALGQVEGRTGPEAEAFKVKAAELRR